MSDLQHMFLKSRVYQNDNCLSTHKRAHCDLHIIDFEIRTKLINCGSIIMKLDNLNQLYVRCSSHRSPIRYSSYHANQAEIKLFFCTPPYDKFVFIQLIYGTTILCCIFYHSRYRVKRK